MLNVCPFVLYVICFCGKVSFTFTSYSRLLDGKSWLAKLACNGVLHHPSGSVREFCYLDMHM